MATPKPHEDPTLDEVTIPAGTLIHIAGYPFYLPVDTKVRGRQANYDLAQRAYKLTAHTAHLGVTPDPATVQPGDAAIHAGLPDNEKNVDQTKRP